MWSIKSIFIVIFLIARVLADWHDNGLLVLYLNHLIDYIQMVEMCIFLWIGGAKQKKNSIWFCG